MLPVLPCPLPLPALSCLFASHSSMQEREKARELELIKQQYLGAEKQKKKVLKATERMKFVFDWDAGEDTSRDLNPLYQNLHGALRWVVGGELGGHRGGVLWLHLPDLPVPCSSSTRAGLPHQIG